jgi:hypothetical protein
MGLWRLANIKGLLSSTVRHARMSDPQSMLRQVRQRSP